MRDLYQEISLLHIVDVENWTLVPADAALDVNVQHLVVSKIFSGLPEAEIQAQNLRQRSQRSLSMIHEYF